MPIDSSKRHSIVTADLDTILSMDVPWPLLDGKTVLVTGA
jgi:hypothetical protein